jgi:Family of unknown function (DUF5670)
VDQVSEGRGAPVSRRQPAGEEFPREPEAAIRLLALSRGARGWIDGGKIMLWTIVGVLVLLWLLGFLGHVGGGLIHLLLVVAAIVFVVNLLSNRRTV